MTSLRRRLRLPRLSNRIYVLILALFLALAYIVGGPAYQFFAKLQSNLGSFYEPKDFQREEYMKSQEEKNL